MPRLAPVSPSVILSLVVLALALSAPRPILADLWYEHYADAEAALAAQDWAAAIEELNSALEKKGDPGARARTYGMKFTAYFPYLKLGVAYYELGQIDAALQAFETEERLGAIAQSDGGSAELQRYRALALKAQEAAADEERARLDRTVSDSLAQAARLEEAGDVEGAIAALGPALALVPDEPRATAMIQRLRLEFARIQDEKALRDRIATLVDRGRALLSRDAYTEAASVLRQALDLADDDDAASLLAQAQRGLREQLRTDERSRSIAQGLDDASELETAGRLEEALEKLQPVLALDPNNSRARSIERRLLDRRAEAEQKRSSREAVEGFLANARSALSEDRFEDALAMANRALAVDAGNETALEQLAQAYRAINGRLLGAPAQQNFPPAIRFADRRQELEDGSFAESVQRRSYRLTGVVIDNSAVEIEFFDADGRRLEANVNPQKLGDLVLTEFQVARDLPEGANTLRLIATDASGMTSSAEYEVVYSPPLFRSRWFYAALAALLVLAAAAVGGTRARRRRRLRRRRFNPYVAGAPVLDDRLFFGREQLLQRILQTLHNNSLLLHGERRIGKTSLQHQLKRRLEAMEDPVYDFFPVYIDLQGTREERFFATLGAEIFEELGPVLDGLEPHAPFSGPYSYRDLVADLRAVLKALHVHTDKRIRLVLLIDEVDELNSYDPKVNQKLRSLFMKSFAEELVAVVSGVSIKREWDREGSPWYNFFEEVDVGPFAPEHARKLVEEPIRGVLQLDSGVVERIVELTGGRPYRIQRLCMKLVSRAHESGRRTITVADVEAIGDPDSRGAA